MIKSSNGNSCTHDLFRISSLSRFIPAVFLLISALLTLSNCSGGGSSDNVNSADSSNTGGGFTLKASGGTMNDGSVDNGIVVLATLRDSSGSGPSMPWTLTITGPGIGVPLTVSYDDGSPSSYMTWWWENFNPLTGTYTATATNGSTALVYKFSLKAASNLSQPAVNKNGSTISWNSITGTGSYYYRVTDGTGADVMTPGYFSADPLQTTYSFSLPVLTGGSYLIQVYAQTTDRVMLQNSISPSPALASQENMSRGAMDFVQGGGYSLNAEGGVLYEGISSETGTNAYGLVIWTSILTTTTPTTAPAGDWTVSVTGPGISGSAPIVFTYPRTDSQYVYWDFGTVPAPATSGTYTVTATPTAGGASVSQTFTIPDETQQLPVSTVTASATNGGGANVSWTAVTGANSYYVNVWADVNGVYTEIAGSWFTGVISAAIAKGTLTKGTAYDVYVSACQLDMTDTTTVPPSAPGAQVNMSDTTFTYDTITAQ